MALLGAAPLEGLTPELPLSPTAPTAPKKTPAPSRGRLRKLGAASEDSGPPALASDDQDPACPSVDPGSNVMGETIQVCFVRTGETTQRSRFKNASVRVVEDDLNLP